MVTTPQLSKGNFKERKKKSWSRVPDSDLTPGQTSRLTVCRKVTVTLISILMDHKVSLSEYGLSLVIREFQSSFKLINIKTYELYLRAGYRVRKLKHNALQEVR
jgi:hypothetical protein